jgi:endonuclease-3
MTVQQKKETMARIVEALKEIYPAAECALEYHGEGWKLLVMGRLSAQCTDKRVNQVCEILFSRFPTCRDLADGDLTEIEEIVRSCGLYRTKAANIKESCRILCDAFGGEVPQDMDVLLTFPGVGRKIANLLRGDLYHLPAIVADTHCIRICERFGMTPKGCKDPVKTEQVMVKLVAPAEQSDFCHRIVWFGREVCTARSPKCGECPLRKLCAVGKKTAEKEKIS